MKLVLMNLLEVSDLIFANGLWEDYLNAINLFSFHC